MTRTEKAELEELNMTPEDIEERCQQLEAKGVKARPHPGTARVMYPALKTGLPSAVDLDAVAAEQKAAQETARKPRSDKGAGRL